MIFCGKNRFSASFFHLLFTPSDIASDWIKAEQDIGSADRRGRNILATAYQYQQDLRGERLITSNAGVDAKLAAEHAMLDANQLRRKELEVLAAAITASCRFCDVTSKDQSFLKILRIDIETNSV